MDLSGIGKAGLKSVTIWGAIATALGFILPQFGIGTAEDIRNIGEGVSNIILSALQVGGLILVVYGRWHAKEPISTKKTFGYIVKSG